jgi:hypothetical protein
MNECFFPGRKQVEEQLIATFNTFIFNMLRTLRKFGACIKKNAPEACGLSRALAVFLRIGFPSPQEKRESLVRDHSFNLIENLHHRLSRLEDELGLPVTNFAQIRGMYQKERPGSVWALQGVGCFFTDWKRVEIRDRD